MAKLGANTMAPNGAAAPAFGIHISPKPSNFGNAYFAVGWLNEKDD